MVSERDGLSPADWDQWSRQRATQAFARTLQQAIEDAKEAWASGAYVSSTPEASSRLNLTALAEVRSLQKVLEAIDSYKLPARAEGDSNE